MTRFKKDLEVLINEGFIAPSNNSIRFVFKYSNRFKGDISFLGLSDRSYNCLRRNKISDISLIDSMWENLYNLKGAGIKTVKEIKNKYVEYYYNLLNEEEKKDFWTDTIKATVEMGC